jgi:hypothetical protein
MSRYVVLLLFLQGAYWSEQIHQLNKPGLHGSLGEQGSVCLQHHGKPPRLTRPNIEPDKLSGLLADPLGFEDQPLCILVGTWNHCWLDIFKVTPCFPRGVPPTLPP